MVIERIADINDPRIGIFRNLKDKVLHREGQFIIEGKFILETLIMRSKYQILSVFIQEDRILPLETILAKIPDDIPIYVAEPEMMAAIAGFDVHRGILAAGRAQSTLINLPTYLNAKHAIAVLSNIANPDNVGAIFRNAAGLGIDGIVLDIQCCSPLYRKAIRVSMGASLVLPWIQTGSVEDVVQQLKADGFSVYALSLQGSVKIENARFAARSAFLFGEEAHGLPISIQAQCQAITIPMSAGTDSLNVAASSAIVFDSARRGKS